MRKNFNLFFLLLLLAVYTSSAVTQLYAEESAHEIEYLKLKSFGRYFEAVDFLEKSSSTIDNEYHLELNIIRLMELMIYPELYPAVEKTLSAFSKNKILIENPRIMMRINLIRNRLLLAKGQITDSAKIIDSSGFLKFKIIGPFLSVTEDDFSLNNPAWYQYDAHAEYPAKVYRTKWFDAKSDREGKVNADNFFSDTSDSLCIFYSEFNAPKDDTYRINFGKTGYTDIKLDDKILFSNRNRHAFFHDQYYIDVFLGKGRHKILIKTADSRDGIKFAARLTDLKGNPIHPNGFAQKSNPELTKLIASGILPVLEYYTAKKTIRPIDSFNAGYLHYMSGFSTENNSESSKHLSSIAKDDPYYPYANYYLALSENSYEAQDQYLKKSYRANGQSIETVAEMAKLKIKSGFFYEAYPLIMKIKEIDKNSHYVSHLLTYFYYEKGWNLDLIRECDSLKNENFFSAGLIYASALHINEKSYIEAAEELIKIYSLDKYNYTVFENLVSCKELSGALNGAMALLLEGAALYPDKISIKLWIAKIDDILNGPSSSLVYLSSAKQLSPFHKDVFLSTGFAYEMMNKPELAKKFILLASYCDPDNYSIKRYLSLKDNSDEIYSPYQYPDDITDIIEESYKYKDEPALTLLQENIINVNSDGSFEKRIRFVYKINDKDHAQNFNYQYIVYDPFTEYPEKIKCINIADDVRNEITEKHRRSLSDPDSRLYYNLEALVIPANPAKGSIIDFSYTIKNRGGSHYKNYFGEKIILGSKYRTLKSNTVLIYPDGKNINQHAMRFDKSQSSKTKIASGYVCKSFVDNIPPLKEEPAMPHSSTILPSISFTSFNNWDELSAYYKNLLNNKIRVSPLMKKDLALIISSDDEEEIKVKKIFNHVTSKIRYVGFEFGLGGIQPRPADMTYQSGMGDCKDVSILLAAMLREAGIDSSIALLRTRDKGVADISIPLMGEFNHAICYVNLKKGIEFFIDGTSRSSGYKELPADDRNAAALVIDERTDFPKKRGETKYWFFKNTDTGFYEKEFESIKTSITLKEDGSAFMNRSLIKYGTYAAATRESLNDPVKQEKSLIEYWNKMYPGSKINSLEITNFAKDSPAEYSYSVITPSFAIIGNDYIIINPFLSKSDYYRDFAFKKSRTFELRLSGKNTTEIITDYKIPDNYSAIVPKNELFSHNKFTADFKYHIINNKIEVYSSITFKDYTITVDDYKEFRNFSEFIHRKESERIILLKK